MHNKDKQCFCDLSNVSAIKGLLKTKQNIFKNNFKQQEKVEHREELKSHFGDGGNATKFTNQKAEIKCNCI